MEGQSWTDETATEEYGPADQASAGAERQGEQRNSSALKAVLDAHSGRMWAWLERKKPFLSNQYLGAYLMTFLMHVKMQVRTRTRMFNTSSGEQLAEALRK